MTPRPCLAALALVASACATNVAATLDPEGHACRAAEDCPAGFACVQGACHADPCAALGCETRPPVCVGGAVVVNVASCDAAKGACTYQAHTTACAAGCSNGACASACTASSCLTPPAAACLDAHTLRSYPQPGTCTPADGTCTFAPQDTACAAGCANGACTGQNPCLNVTCTTPPGPSCFNATTVRTWGMNGTCAAGACSYLPIDTACGGACVNGACALTFAQIGPRVPFAINGLDQAPGSMGATVLAVGNAGRLALWNGTDWVAVAAPAQVDLNSVAFTSPTLGWIVGRNRTVWQFKNNAVLPLASGPQFAGSANLVSVHGLSDTNVLIAEETGDVAFLGAAGWTNDTLPNNATAMRRAYVDETGRQRVSGLCDSNGSPRGCVAYRNFALTTAWRFDLDSSSGSLDAMGGWLDVGTSTQFGAADVLVGRPDNTLVRAQNAGGFLTANVPTLPSGNGVVGVTGQAAVMGDPPRPVYVLTSSSASVGHLYRLTRATPGTTPAVASLLETYFGEETLSSTESAGVIVAEVRRAANANNIYRRSALVNEALDLGEDWAAVTADVLQGLVLVSNFGDVAVRRAGAPTYDFQRGPSVTVTAAEARRGASLLLVGQDGASTDGYLERFTPALGFSRIAVSAPGTTFNGVCRVSDAEGWVVGTGGAIVAVNATSLGVRAASPTTRDLLAVDCSTPGAAVACGAGGTVLKATLGTWAPVTPAFPLATPPITSCRLVNGALWVAGDGFFYRLDPGASAWTQLAARPGLKDLSVLTPQDVLAISGANSTEISRFDGSQWSVLATAPAGLAGGIQIGARVVYGGFHGVLMEGR